MQKNTGKIDWSSSHWKEHLIGPRKYIWLEDTLKGLIAWIDLKQGMVAVDVGCGLGYLGYTFWPSFGKGGCYFGIDESSKLLKDASEASKNWADGGKAYFMTSDAYSLPLPDRFADVVMCQTLLIHLQYPDKALAEMIRVAKNGGIIVCHEPDNLSAELIKRHTSLPEPSIEEQVLFARAAIICNEGRIKLGRGDKSIGCKVPGLMMQSGLTDIDVRMNDRVWHLEPPYISERQKYQRDMMIQHHFDEARMKEVEERMQKEFLAGGGTKKEFNHYMKLANRYRDIIKQQVEDEEFYGCGGGLFYVSKGRKP